MQCPFVYSDGHRCTGEVSQARAYGKNHYGAVEEQNIKKIRLWCSQKGDHAGAVSSFVGKERMEFYPDELQHRGILSDAIALCNNVV
jgi:hypothetical protein